MVLGVDTGGWATRKPNGDLESSEGFAWATVCLFGLMLVLVDAAAAPASSVSGRTSTEGLGMKSKPRVVAVVAVKSATYNEA